MNTFFNSIKKSSTSITFKDLPFFLKLKLYNYLSPSCAQPYLDEEGNLCQDKVETFQDTEYETMIQCRVAMKKTCANQEVTENTQETERVMKLSVEMI